MTDGALAAIRAQLDSIDEQLLTLLAQRFALAPAVAASKPGAPLYRPGREAALLDRVASGPLPAPVARAIWTEIMAAMLLAEGLESMLVETPALEAPARLRFGRTLPVRVDPHAVTHAADPRFIVVLAAQTPLPPGCARVAEVPDEQQSYAGHVVARIG